MPILKRDGVSISYTVSGEGFPVLLSHSFGDTQQMWQPQVRALSAGYRVITWDMRGHGESDSPADPSEYTPEATVGDMLAILDAVNAPQAVIAGLSLGGYLSLLFQSAHPDRCRALVLSSTGPGYRNAEARDGYNAGVEKMAAALDLNGLAALGRTEAASLQRGSHRSADGLARAARGIQKQVDARAIDALPRIQVPVLVLVGEKDRSLHAGSEYMASRIPGAKLVTILNAGHSANLHQPETFNRAMLEFLAQIGLQPAVHGG